MRRRIKFGLNMPEKENIRTLDELREFFDVRAVMEYFLNGKLLTWLEDRHYKEAETVRQLDCGSENLAEELCAVFGVKTEQGPEASEVKEKVDRLEKLKQITSDADVLAHADEIIFTQEELENALQNPDRQVLYLYGDKFTIPVEAAGKKYVGVNRPEIYASTLEKEKLAAFSCPFENVELETAFAEALLAIKKEREGFHRKEQTYKVSSSFDTMLDDKKREVSKEIFNRIQDEFKTWQYDLLKDSKAIAEVINGSDLQGYGRHFTENTRIADVIRSSNLRGYVQQYLNRLA